MGDLIATVDDDGGTSLAALADDLVLELDELLPILDAGELLQRMEVEEGQLRLTAAGQQLRAASEEGQQGWLRAQLVAHVPLIWSLQAALEASPRAEVEGERELELLNEQFTRTEAAAVFATLVSWTRSCGLYRYNRERDVFRLAEVGADD